MNKYKSNKLVGKVIESVQGFSRDGHNYVSSLIEFTDGTKLRMEVNKDKSDAWLFHEEPEMGLMDNGNLEWENQDGQNVQAQLPLAQNENPAQDAPERLAAAPCSASSVTKSDCKQTLKMGINGKIILSSYRSYDNGENHKEDHVLIPISSIKELFANPESVVDIDLQQWIKL